jgi:hypothetical protein
VKELAAMFPLGVKVLALLFLAIVNSAASAGVMLLLVP